MTERLSQQQQDRKKLSEEDAYVEDTLSHYGDMVNYDIKTGKRINLTPEQQKDKLRKEYRAMTETVREMEGSHLQSLRGELTPLILHYKEAALHSEAVGDAPEPHVSPNLDKLVELLEEHDKEYAENVLKKYAPQELVSQYDAEQLDELTLLVRHIQRNAEDVSDENLKLGGSKVERDLDRLFKEKFDPDHEPIFGEKSRASYLNSLGLRRSEKVLWGDIYGSVDTGDAFGRLEVIQVSQYGEQFSRRLFKTMQQMVSLTPLIKEEATHIATTHEEVFKKTARGRDSLKLGAWLAVQEGIVSLFQTLALLTAEKVDGYDNPDQLVRDIVAAHLPNQIAYLAPAATIGPLSLMGKYVSGIVQKGSSSGLVINSEVKSKMLARKKEEFGKKVKEYMYSREGELRLPAVGRGCPVALESDVLKTTGVKELTDLFLTIFERRNSNP